MTYFIMNQRLQKNILTKKLSTKAFLSRKYIINIQLKM